MRRFLAVAVAIVLLAPALVACGSPTYSNDDSYLYGQYGSGGSSSTTYIYLSGIDCEKGSGTYGELAVRSINLWESPGPDRGGRVGSLSHGARVLQLDKRWVSTESRNYYLVQSGNEQGWVPDAFVRVSRPGNSGCS